MISKRRVPLIAGVAACTILSTAFLADAPVQAQSAQAEPIAFDIPAGTLQSALIAFAKQSRLQLIYAPEAVAGRRVVSLHAHLSAQAALHRLIRGSGLIIRQVSPKVIVLKKDGRSPAADTTGATGSAQGTPGEVDALPDEQSLDTMAAIDRASSKDIIVTGTNIRGGKPVGSSVRTLTHAEMQRNGYATVADALQALPGNFGGAATEQSALSLTDQSGTNATLSTGVNLRGLGADATLVLVNGHRIAGSGTHGDFADVSDIPMSIVDRVEILMDGASAIYGSDAVGGVVNIITKDRYKGLGIGFRVGGVTDGHSREIKAHVNAGTTWGGGSLLLSYEFYRHLPLYAADRRFARSADLRPLGGTDHRYPYSLPGNILGADPQTGALVPIYAIPTGQDGTALTPGDFEAGVTNLQNFQTGAWLTAKQTRHSVFGSLHQDLTRVVHASLEARFTRRDFDSRGPGYATILTVTSGNPWFVSPDAQPYDLIGYSFAAELGGTRTHGWSQAFALTGSVDIDLSPQWRFRNYVAFAQNRELSRSDHIANSAILSEALGTIPHAPGNAYDPAEHGYFNPYGNGMSNSPAVLAAVGSGYQQSRLSNDVLTGNTQVDGPLFDLPGGAVRLALGANLRRETFARKTSTFLFTDEPSISAPVDYRRTILAGYGEIRVPVFSRTNARPGIQRLAFSLAGRIEHYPAFGTTANPKVGVDWAPLRGLTLRGTFGTSFRAPNLLELHSRSSVSATVLPDAEGQSRVVLVQSGGNPSLRPERARSWTLGAEVTPTGLPGLRLNATLFRTIFDRKIDRPVVQDLANALISGDLAPFVRAVSPATSAADRAEVTALLGSAPGAGSAYPVNAVAAIVDARYVNTGKADVRGLDFSLGYRTIAGRNTFDFNANATYLLAWRQQATPTSLSIDQRNRAGRPVTFRGRATAGWTRGAVDALIGINFVNAYHDLVGNRIDSWTTMDARLAWTPKAKSGLLSNAMVALSLRNLFDTDPPFYDSNAGIGYDAANSSAIGRFISLQVTKHW